MPQVASLGSWEDLYEITPPLPPPKNEKDLGWGRSWSPTMSKPGREPKSSSRPAKVVVEYTRSGGWPAQPQQLQRSRLGCLVDVLLMVKASVFLGKSP